MPVNSQMFRLCIICIAVFTLQACATSSALLVARDQFRHGSATDALQTLSEAKVSSRDQLLLYLDRGLIAQASGQYLESKIAFERALEIIDELDYVSVRDQAASIISSDWAARYSGESSEKLWVHTFQMLNYLFLNSPEGAAVEARRAAAFYEENKDVLKDDIFTRTLMALSFESAGQINSARVEYRKLADDFDLELPAFQGKNESEIIFIIASGFIEPKLAGDLFISFDARIAFPYYAHNYQLSPQTRVVIDGNAATYSLAETTMVSISQAALAARGKALAARQALRVAAKYHIADSVGEKSDTARVLAQFLLVALEQADTRSWETLPAHLTLLRVPLTPGAHSISLDIESASTNTGQLNQSRIVDVELAPGQRLFKLIRTDIAAQ